MSLNHAKMYLHGLSFHTAFKFLFPLFDGLPGVLQMLFDELQILFLVVDALPVLFNSVVELSNLVADAALALMFLGLASHVQAFLEVDQGGGEISFLLLVLLCDLHVDVDEVL